MQATLISFYPKKPGNLTKFLKYCQSLVSKILGPNFRQYEIEQIHATIVGLERDETHRDMFYNQNYKKCRQRDITMDFDGFFEFLRSSRDFPFQVQVGGFQDRDYSLVSRGTRPFNRSYSLQGRNAVIIGWPIHEESAAPSFSGHTLLNQGKKIYPNTLDTIRRAAQEYGILHAYHSHPPHVDNDFYFRIGRLEDPASPNKIQKAQIESALCESLSVSKPLIINVQLSDFFVTFYDSDELPINSTTFFPFTDKKLTGAFIRSHY